MADTDGVADVLPQMVRVVDPTATIQAAEPAERGFSSVYELTIQTESGQRRSYLKAPAPGDDSGVAADARLTALLERRTSIPVPSILGLVEDHPEVPTPYYVSAAVEGAQVPYQDVGWISDGHLRTVSAQLGRSLGELHRIGGIERFGHVTASSRGPYTGGPPEGTVEDLAVEDGGDTWPEYLRGRVDYQLDRLAGTRFEGLRSPLATWIHAEIDALSGPFEPVLGRNDHGFHNLLVDPDSGAIAAMLDWAYTLAVPPSFDVEFAVYLFSGAFLSGIPEVPDRRELVRDVFLDGYRETAPGLVAQISTPTPLYEMLARLRILTDFELLEPRLPEERIESVADTLEAEVESVLSA